MPYLVPQVQIRQEATLQPAEINEPLRAVIVGPHAHLIRHDVASEADAAVLGTYDPLAETAYPWPERPAGAALDADSVVVRLTGARLRYLYDLVGAGETIAPVAGRPSRIAMTSGTGGFRANGAAHPRLAALGDRDVQPGDRVTVRGTSGGDTYTLESYVRRLVADLDAAVVGAAASGASNGPTQASSAVVAQVSGTVNANDLEAAVAGYDGKPDGVLDETYTVTVIKGSTGGDLASAVLRVTSASGLDDDLAVSPEDIGTYFAAGGRGLQLRFVSGSSLDSSTSADDLVVGQTWTVTVADDYTAVSATSGGAYTGLWNTTYIVEVVRGGTFAAPSLDDRPQVAVRTTTGVDAGVPQVVSATGVPLPVGHHGVTIMLDNTGSPAGLRKGDSWSIPVTAAQAGRYATIEMGHVLPPELRTAADLELQLALVADLDVPRLRADAVTANWTAEATQLVVAAGMMATDPSLTSGGVPVAADVVGGTLAVSYRAWRQDLVGTVGSIGDSTLLDTLIPGALDPDNPLKWGALKALAGGAPVTYLAVSDPDSLDAWSEALGLLAGREDAYGLVPLSHDAQVLALCQSHVANQSTETVNRWRFLWACPRIDPAAQKVGADASGAVVLAAVEDDPDASGTQYTLLTLDAGGPDLVEAGVAPGDRVRYQYATVGGAETYAEYEVDAVLGSDRLRLVTGPADAQVSQRVEIWHTRTQAEVASAAAATAAAFGSRRVASVFPDTVVGGGVTQPGYFLAAALAGQRAGARPHQPLTNAEVVGFESVPRVEAMAAPHLDIMSGGGVWVVARDPSGALKTRHAVTSATTGNLNDREESVVANVDSISYLILRRLRPFIGVSVVTRSTLDRMRAEVRSAVDYLKSNGYTDTLGGQLIDARILALDRHALNADTVVIALRLEVPYPVNYIDVTLVF